MKTIKITENGIAKEDLENLDDSSIFFVNIDDIKVPDSFISCPPSGAKLTLKRKQFKLGDLDPIYINKDGFLVDKYINYIVFKERGIKFVKCKLVDVTLDNFSDCITVSNSVLIAELLKKQNSKCFICERELGKDSTTKPRITWLVPQSKNGKRTYSNIRLCCSYCNKFKGEFSYSSPLVEVIKRELCELGLL